MGKLLDIANKSVSRAPMKHFEQALISLEKGVENDFRGSPGDRQVTVLCKELWEEACSELGTSLPWDVRRANLYVEGLDISNAMGKLLHIGNVVLEVCRESTPCSRMDEQYMGLQQAMLPNMRGGIMCKVIKGGKITIGDTVKLLIQ